MFQITWTQKIVIAIGIYLLGVVTPLYYRMKNPVPPTVEVRTVEVVKDTSKSRSKTQGVKKGTSKVSTVVQPDGTRSESRIDEFEVVVENTTDTQKTTETNKTITLPVTSVNRYSLGVGYNYWTSLINLSGGIRVFSTPIHIFGYLDALSLDRETKTVKFNFNGVGIGVRVELP